MASLLLNNPPISESAATIAYKHQVADIKYIESAEKVTKDHLSLFHALRLFVDDVLQGKVPWKLTKLSPKLLQIVDHNYKHHDSIFATDDMLDYLEHYATTSALMACCQGSNWSLSNAKQCILDLVQWRVCSKIDDITPSQFRNSLSTQSVFSLNQTDKRGHPIVHFKVLEIPPADPWTVVRAAVFCIEKCVKLAEQRGVYQLLWMVDLEHLSYSTLPPIEVLLEISNLMTYYYPERLCKSYMLCTPWIFGAILKGLTPYLPERTQRKIEIPGWTESMNKDTFSEDIDEHQLITRFGGRDETRYDYQWELDQFEKGRRVVENDDMIVIEEEQKEIMDDEIVEIKQIILAKKDTEDILEDEDDSKLCIVCLDGARDHVLIPCGHICVCADCKDCYTGDDAECPLCRSKVEMVVKTFH